MSKTGKGIGASNLFSQLMENTSLLETEEKKEEKREEKTAAAEKAREKKAPAAATAAREAEKKEAPAKKESAAKRKPSPVKKEEEDLPKKAGRKAERKLPVVPFEINGHSPVPVAYDDPDIPKKSIITIYTDGGMKDRFKDACYYNRLTMSEAVCFLIEQFIRETELQSKK